jgi:hypothetical protein
VSLPAVLWQPRKEYMSSSSIIAILGLTTKIFALKTLSFPLYKSNQLIAPSGSPPTSTTSPPTKPSKKELLSSKNLLKKTNNRNLLEGQISQKMAHSSI